LHNGLLTPLCAALPLVVLLGSIAVLKLRIHLAALLGLVVAWVIALVMFRMPAGLIATTTLYGGAFGLFPIGWIILNVMFLYQLTVKRGLFQTLRESLAHVAPD